MHNTAIFVNGVEG